MSGLQNYNKITSTNWLLLAAVIQYQYMYIGGSIWPLLSNP